MRRSDKILIKEGITEKISYECRVYESVDDESPSWAMSRKKMKKTLSYLAAIEMNTHSSTASNYIHGALLHDTFLYFRLSAHPFVRVSKFHSFFLMKKTLLA